MGLSSDEHRAMINQMLSALPPPLHDRAICKGCPHPQECRNKPCLNDLARPLLQVNQPTRLMLPDQVRSFEAGLQSGLPLRSLLTDYGRATAVVTQGKLNLHMEHYPVWGAAMRVLIDANHRRSKGDIHRLKDGFCRRGHALPGGPRPAGEGKWYQRCATCATENKKKMRVPTDVNIIGQVVARLLLKQPIGSFTTHGKPGYLLKHHSLKALRELFPVIDQLAMIVIEENRKPKSKAAKPALEKKAPAAVKTTNLRETALTGVIAAQPNDIYTAICEALPANLPEEMRREMISEMYIAVDEGRLALGDLKSNLKGFKKQYRDAYPLTGKYGDRSVDAPAYRDGSTPLVETISKGLW
jgi:hypothetical protein